MGGGNIAPLAENRPLSVKKIRIFKNEPYIPKTLTFRRTTRNILKQRRTLTSRRTYMKTQLKKGQ